MLSLTQTEINNKLDTFNWNFKVGDNLKHNVEEVFYFYELKNACTNNKHSRFLNKHISITLVAVIEGILHDFVVRLSEATNHFPLIINDKKRAQIKIYIQKQKVVRPGRDSMSTRLRVKNYSLSQILDLLEEFELLEQKDSPVYEKLRGATRFRNRIHIYNWYNNFEDDEKNVFTDKRLEILEQLLVYILTTFEAKYARP